MNKWLVGSVLTFIALVAAGCSNFGMSERVINVGMATNYAPLAFEKDGIPQGVEVDFANALENELGAKVNVKVYAWEKLLEALEADEIDVVMSGVSVTEKRNGLMLFSEPYMEVGQMAVIRTEDAGFLASADQLKTGKFRVGYLQHTTGAHYVTGELKAPESKSYTSVKDGVEGLINKEIDYFIHDAPTIWQLTSSYPTDERLFGVYTPLTKEYLAWAVKNGNTELQEELNGVVKTWQENGFITRTVNKWIPVSVTTE